MPINPLSDDSNLTDDEKKNQVGQGESTNVQTGGSGSSASTSSSVAPTATNHQSDSGFVNLNQYIDANKDQSQGLGAKIEENVNQAVNKGTEGLSQAQTQFNQGIQQVSVNPDDYSQDKVFQTAQAASQNPANAQPAIQQFADVRQKATNLASNSDTGPKALTDLNTYQTAKSDLDAAGQKAQLTNDEAGRETLLRESYARPDYSKGQSTLDQLFTQVAPENRQRLESLRSNLLGQYGLADQENQAIQNAANTRQTAVNNTQTANQTINDTLLGPASDSSQGGILTAYQNQLQQNPQSLNSAQQLQYNNALKTVTDNLTKQYGSSVYGIPVADLAKEVISTSSPIGGATIQNTLSDDNVARLRVLNQLAGRDPNLLGSSVLGSLDTTKFDPTVSSDYSKAQTQLQDKLNTINSDVHTLAQQSVAKETPVWNSTMDSGTHLDRINDTGLLNAAAQRAASATAQAKAELDGINQYRAQNGLQPVPIDLAVGHADVISTMENNTVNTNGNPMAYINDRINGQNPYNAAFRQNLDNLSELTAYWNALNSIKNNPLQNVPTATIASKVPVGTNWKL